MYLFKFGEGRRIRLSLPLPLAAPSSSKQNSTDRRFGMVAWRMKDEDMMSIDIHLGVDMMSSGSQQKRPLSEHALRQLIRIAIDKGYYAEHWHAETGHPERNISIDDVIHGLEREDWALVGSPNYDHQHRNYEYLIQTVDVEGDELHIKLAALPDEKRFEVITRW